jgi:hypothetical protein
MLLIIGFPLHTARLRSTDLPETEVEEPVNPPIPVVTEDTGEPFFITIHFEINSLPYYRPSKSVST